MSNLGLLDSTGVSVGLWSFALAGLSSTGLAGRMILVKSCTAEGDPDHLRIERHLESARGHVCCCPPRGLADVDDGAHSWGTQ